MLVSENQLSKLFELLLRKLTQPTIYLGWNWNTTVLTYVSYFLLFISLCESVSFVLKIYVIIVISLLLAGTGVKRMVNFLYGLECLIRIIFFCLLWESLHAQITVLAIYTFTF
jgi:hypothetical protein